MSIIQLVSAQQHPVVLRFAELFPAQLGGYEMHGDRTGGDLAHIDRDRSHLNRILIGPADWREQALDEIEAMRHENLAEEIAALTARGRTEEMRARARDGLKDPWRASKSGPLREVIITANKDWFEAPDAPSMFGNPVAEREVEFEMQAVRWLKTRFGDDVIHARVDRDERACHIHAIIMPRTEKVSKRRGRQRLLQPSIHPLIADYEKAQDDVGAFFSEIGLRRGERSAAVRRRARETGLPPPERREHVRPSRWREDEAAKLRAETDRIEADRRAAATESERVEQLRTMAESELAEARRVKAEAERQQAEATVRQREADGIVAVVEAIEAGLIDVVRRPKAPLTAIEKPTAEQQRILERFDGGGIRAGRFLEQAGSAFRRLSDQAYQAAEIRLRAEFDLARRAIAAANDLRKRAVIAMPAALRARFRQEIIEQDTALMELRNALDGTPLPSTRGRTNTELE